MEASQLEKRSKPFLHFLVLSSKKIHGWFAWDKRECTSERFLLNPYNGCTVGCFYCYARAFPGYFQEFNKKGHIFVFKDFDKLVARQLDSLDIGFCGYLSPVTEPFQKIDKFYNLSLKTIEVFVKRNLPIEFITKENIPAKAISLLREQEHCFGQVSILTLNKKLNSLLSKGAAPDVLLDNLKALSQNRIYSVCRIDPILPFMTDKKEDLKDLMVAAKDKGAKHIIASVLDIPPKLKGYILTRIGKLFGPDLVKKYLFLYKEKIGYLHADINYRKDIFSFLRFQADDLGLTFSLCMEYEDKKGRITGLNDEFSNSFNCEGIDIPIYKRKGNKFYPQANCLGNCLGCKDPVCGIEELAYGKTGEFLALKYSDYRRFSKAQISAD